LKLYLTSSGYFVQDGSRFFRGRDTWDELRANVKEAVEAFYFDSQIPSRIRLHLVRDEVLVAG